MWNRNLSAALMTASLLAPAAHAQTDTTWRFDYTGFAREGVFVPGHRVSGSFTGNDGNGDGVIDLAELSRFTWDGLWFDRQDAPSCSFYRCYLNEFSYSLEGGLAFDFEWTYSSESGYANGETIAGDHIYSYAYSGNGGSESITWNWTGQTRFTINPPPVPEPDGYLLLGAGLLAIATLRRLRTGDCQRPAPG